MLVLETQLSKSGFSRETRGTCYTGLAHVAVKAEQCQGLLSARGTRGRARILPHDGPVHVQSWWPGVLPEAQARRGLVTADARGPYIGQCVVSKQRSTFRRTRSLGT